MKKKGKNAAAARPVKVLFVIDKMDRGGAQSQLIEIFAAPAPRSFTPLLCCLLSRGSLAPSAERLGVKVFCLGLPDITGMNFFRAAGRLAQLARDSAADLLHAWLFSANLVAPAAGLLCRRPVITSRRDSGFWKKGRHVAALRAANLLTRFITVNSAPVRDYVRKREKAPASKIRLLHNGLNVPAASVRRPVRPRPGNRLVLGCLGNIGRVKGYADLLAALESAGTGLPPYQLEIAGRVREEEHFRELKKRANSALGPDRVVFVGEVSDPEEFLDRVDIFILPSRSEGFSNSLLRAMAAAKPVIATAVGGNPEAIEDGRDGVLVPAADPAALSAAICRLAGDPAERARMGKSARQRVVNDFSAAALLARLSGLYREAVR